MTRARALLLAVALVAGLVTPASATAGTEPTASDNLDFVTNLEFEQRPDLGDPSRLATDVDFHTFTVVEEGPDGEEVEVDRDFAFVGTYVNGLQVVDVTDPEEPSVVAVYECAVAQADVFLFEREDLGRVFVAYSSDTIAGQTNFDSRCHTDNGVLPGQYGTFVVDVTDPFDPQSVSFIEFPRGTHQVTVHPSGEWVYSSPSDLTTFPGDIDIADIADPWEPVVVEPLDLQTGGDAHDLSFSADGTRAYAAALTHTVIVDSTDPGQPEVIGRIIDPAITIHHEAHAVTMDDPLVGERTFLLIGDEFAGAAGNQVCPGGAVHVYDITDDLEQTPVKLGAFFMPEAGLVPGEGQGAAGTTRCTAHVLQLHPDEGIMIAAWYAAGVRIVDISAIAGVSAGVQAGQSLGAGMREIGYGHFDNSDTWAAKTNRIAEDGSFHVFGIDTARQLDVWKFTPDEDQHSDASGRWLTPDEAVAAKQAMGLYGTVLPTSTYCTL